MLKIENQFLQDRNWSVQNGIQDRYHVSQALLLVILKIEPWDQNLMFCPMQAQGHWFYVIA
jgi:hypothetical protein